MMYPMHRLPTSLLGCALLLSACTGVLGAGGGGQTNSNPPGGGTNSGAGAAPVGPDGQPIPGAGAGGLGSVTASGGAGSSTPVPSTAPEATPAIARLSTLQWANSIRDLLKLTAPGDLDNALTKDAVVRFDNEADSLFVAQDLRDDLQSAAERLAALVTADPQAVARLIPAGAPTDVAGKGKAFITDFGRKAFRRPLTDAEVQSYVTLFNQGPTLTTGMGAFEAGMRVTLEAFLQSPGFLYRTAIGGTAVAGRARLTDFEIAANLAYALTNYPPDAALSGAADKSALAASGAIQEQAKRLLATDQGKVAVGRFYFQYFGLGQYDTLQKDAAIAPQFTPGIGVLLDQEAQQLLQYLFTQNLGLREIFTTSVGFVNAPIAKLYGLTGTFDANTWTQVAFDATQRPGILTRLGFLSYYAYQNRQDTIHRGANINSRILCNELQKPPDIVTPELPSPDPSLTNRQQITELTKGGVCVACHTSFINPAGFAFENFDGLGNYRTMEGALPVDSSGEYRFLDGSKKFANLAEFTTMIAESSQAHACYTKKWAADLYARVPRRGDEDLAADLAQKSIASRLSSMDVVLALVSSDAFVTRVEGQQ